jgi:hypothetical protein
LRNSHFWTVCSVPPIDGRTCGSIQLVAGQIRGGWENAEDTVAAARAQAAMMATTMAALVRITVAEMRRS